MTESINVTTGQVEGNTEGQKQENITSPQEYVEILASAYSSILRSINSVKHSIENVKDIIQKYPQAKDDLKNRQEETVTLVTDYILRKVHLPWYVPTAMVKKLIRKNVIKLLEKI